MMVIGYGNPALQFEDPSWSATIKSNGHVLQEYQDVTTWRTVRKEFRLKEHDMQELFDQVRKADFASLHNRYEGPVEDGGYSFDITVTMNGKTRGVTVWAPDEMKGNRDVQRLMSLWKEILRKVPHPKPEQKGGAGKGA